MSSEISRTLTAYRTALDQSRNRYESLYHERGSNALDFYQRFGHRLVRGFSTVFGSAPECRRLHRQAERLFGTAMLDFVAIDGSCNKDLFTDFVTFSACAYGAKGQLTLTDGGERPAIHYRRWELSRDVSMVAYVPVPFAQLADAVGGTEDFLMSDQERVNLAQVHTKLMQLAEVYLAYNVVSSSTIERPRLVLMDLLPSSVLASIAGQPSAVKLGGYYHDRRRLTYSDIVIALAHPFSETLPLPNRNKFRLHQLILAEVDKASRGRVDLRDIARKHNLDPQALRDAASDKPLFCDSRRYQITPEGLLDRQTSPPRLIPRAAPVGQLQDDLFSVGSVGVGGEWQDINVRESWQFTVSLFRSICDRLFRKKAPEAMIYQTVDANGQMREHWLDPDDIDFLVSVGLRALIETCWQQDVMLLGIAKDSSSRYFTRNYLGVLKHGLKAEELAYLEVGRLPWTDRMFFEFVASEDETVAAPWGSCEFDSAFMTLWVAQGNERPEQLRLGAVQDYIVAHTGLFARSLAQFYLNRAKATALMGHMVFVDRLLTPKLDAKGPWLDLRAEALSQAGLESHRLGDLRPLGYRDATAENVGQDLAMYLLSCLTRNHYPEVIGYPDPLHKADWGAKTLGDRLRATIRSSQAAFAARPLARTFRAIRESYKRR